MSRWGRAVFFRGLVLAATGAWAVSAGAQERADIAATLNTLGKSGGQPRLGHATGGDLSCLGAPAGDGFAAGTPGAPADAARLFLLDHASAFGVRSNKVDFIPDRESTGDGRTYVHLKQTYEGVPVFGGEVLAQVGKENRIESLTADILRRTGNLEKSGRKGVVESDPAAAVEAALAAAHSDSDANDLGPSEGPMLVVYAPDVIGATGPAVLAWQLVIESARPGVFKEQYLVNARTGVVALHFSLIETAKNRQIFDAANTSADPGTLVRNEGGPAVSLADANLAYQYYGDTYDFYFTHHGRDSVDGAGLTLSATVRYCDPSSPCPFENAFWDGTRMYFGQGFSAADDVVAHELTHGVTQFTSQLIYVNQSGALNESFSDVWGEFVDQSNSSGTDTPAVKWLLGEDVPGFGAIRNMKDPTLFGDPDSTCSPNWYSGGADNGGVHTNSNVNNKLCYLLTDGDTFNGHTVSGMGIATVASLYYEVQTNLLTAGANYLDLYHALQQAAINLSLSAGQQANIEEACAAVAITDATSCQLPPPPPANDACASAVAVTVDVVYDSDISGATGTESMTCGGDLGDFNDIWYTFAPPATGLYTVSLCQSGGGTTDTTLGIFTGNCATHTLIACDDEGCNIPSFGIPSELVTTLNQGTNYLVRVAGFFGSTGPTSLVVHSGDTTGGNPTIVCNDHATGRLDNFSPRWDRIFSTAVSTVCNATATDSANDNMAYEALPFHAQTTANLSAVLDQAGTAIVDTVLAVYCDPFNPAQPSQHLITYNDDFVGMLSGFSDTQNITLTAGTTYWMVISTFQGSQGGQLLDSGVYDICLGPNFKFGYPGSENTCTLDTCPAFDAEGTGLYAYLSTVLSATLNFDDADLDGQGIPERFEVALAEKILCSGGVSWANSVRCDFEANRTALEAETGFNTLAPLEDVIAALMMTSSGMQQTLGSALGLTGTYAIASGSGAKASLQDLSPNGDPDQDGYTNLEEYLNVVADGNDEAEYVRAALDPLVNGSESSVADLPIAGIAGLGLLALLMAPLGAYSMGKRRDARAQA